MRRWMVVFITLLAVTFLVNPAFAAKKPIADKELDEVTAAGQPRVFQFGPNIVAGGNVSAGTRSITSIDFSDTPFFDLTAEGGSQTDLRALVLNNVSGENQVGTGVNVVATTAGTGQVANAQANDITQTWGSTKDFASSGPLSCTKVASCKAGAPLSVAGDFIFHFGANVQAGGNVSAKMASAFSLQFASAPLFTMTLQAGSQTDLAALVVNNTVGQNQLATGVNIASGAVAVLDSAGKLLLDGSTGTIGTNQSNTICQARGDIRGC